MAVIEEREGSVWLFRCDACGKQFEGRKEKALSKTQGCSRSCGSRASRETVKQNLLEKRGVENVSQLPEVRAKVEKTSLERFGARCSWQNDDVKRKIRETLKERYGAEHPSQSPVILARREVTMTERYGGVSSYASPVLSKKAKQTMLERYGAENPQQVEQFKRATIETNLSRYGVENPQQSPEIRERTSRTCIEKYGATNPFGSLVVQEKARNTCKQRYGVEYASQSPEIQRKIFETMRRNGSGKGFVSKGELKCLSCLIEIYGDEVQHQVTMHKWLVDFYIPSTQTFGQFDGNYWHGVDLTKEQLQRPASRREKSIVKKRTRDAEQREWATAAGVRLVRVVESDFQSWIAMGEVHSMLKKLFG